MGTRVYTGWSSRYEREEKSIEPYKKYVFICEGQNTEVQYFKKFISLRKQIGIHSLIDIQLLERTDEDRSNSYVTHLYRLANEYMEQGEFDKEHDKMIVVFDADIFEYKSPRYNELVVEGERNSFMLGVTNPGFEIFLLLHFDNAYKELIEPDINEFLKEENLGKKGLAYRKLLDKTNMNSKTNFKIGELAENITKAIAEEKKLNQDIHNCKGRITSNIGKIIEKIIDERDVLD
ncbi:MAG: RloB family protein [Eubacteriales bacterium]|nr:RloB family protein [Eubacteriales bacterium]